MILLIDNYDSFVHNLARYVRELGGEAVVRRNDAVTLDEIASLAPSHIIVSPGPCSPAESGISIDLIRRFGPTDRRSSACAWDISASAPRTAGRSSAPASRATAGHHQ